MKLYKAYTSEFFGRLAEAYGSQNKIVVTVVAAQYL